MKLFCMRLFCMRLFCMRLFCMTWTMILILIAWSVLIGFAGQKNLGTLIITINGFENSKGIAKLALVDSKENYSASEPFQGFNCKITDNLVNTEIQLPYGEYAIKVYHDENGNDKMDKRMFGIPIERYGFSNNARSAFGPPEYQEAVFTIESPEKEISITVK